MTAGKRAVARRDPFNPRIDRDPPLTKLLDWFAAHGWTPFDFQRETWSRYLAGESGLIHAPTGVGKTLAAWGGPLLEALPEPSAARRTPPLRVLWITPLRALANDTVLSLRAPLDELGLPWTVELRTSDTSASVRARQKRQYGGQRESYGNPHAARLGARPESSKCHGSLVLSRSGWRESWQRNAASLCDKLASFANAG